MCYLCEACAPMCGVVCGVRVCEHVSEGLTSGPGAEVSCGETGTLQGVIIRTGGANSPAMVEDTGRSRAGIRKQGCGTICNSSVSFSPDVVQSTRGPANPGPI